MKALLGVFIFIGMVFLTEGQRVCGSAEYLKKVLASDPSLKASFDQAEEQIRSAKLPSRALARDPAADQIITIPVVIHVIYNNSIQNISDEQIKSQIEALNNDFRKNNPDVSSTPGAFSYLAADTKISFCLAQVDPQGRRTSGIIRKSTTKELFFADDDMKFTSSGGDNAWDNKKYLNFWVCNLGGRSLGYATLPGGPAERDGIVIAYDVFGTKGNVRAPFNKGRTATHEAGHWMGLKHIWGDESCGSDDVDDTPTQNSYNFGCPSFPHVSSCSPDGNGDMFMNFMDFTDDACMHLFTFGQKARMRALFRENNLRNTFLNSFACDSALAQSGPLPADTVSLPVVVIHKADTVELKTYPNPVIDFLTVEFKTTASAGKPYIVYNTVGMQVLSGQLNSVKNKLDLSKLSKGVYVLRIGNGKNAISSKVIRQ